MVAVAGNSCIVSSCKMSHFGINPVSGGRPPRDSRAKVAVAVRRGDLDQLMASVLIFVVDVNLNVKKVVAVIIMYMVRARMVSCGFSWAIIIIHPRWAMEEYARIFRSWVWFSPPQPPAITEVSPKAVSSSGLVVGAI